MSHLVGHTFGIPASSHYRTLSAVYSKGLQKMIAEGKQLRDDLIAYVNQLPVLPTKVKHRKDLSAASIVLETSDGPKQIAFVTSDDQRYKRVDNLEFIEYEPCEKINLALKLWVNTINKIFKNELIHPDLTFRFTLKRCMGDNIMDRGKPLERTTFIDDINRDFAVLLNGLYAVPPSESYQDTSIANSVDPSKQSFVKDTAFIMMWMDPAHPDLEDVAHAFKDVCKEFGISAVRADDIEHQDVITNIILDRIKSSEFLIADLTGERPNVYYEIGYAHAIGKRPILYRKEGTKLHFDLSVHNVPAYRNTTELKGLLRKRLEAMTGKTLS